MSTVKDLIVAFSQLPPDLEVFIDTSMGLTSLDNFDVCYINKDDRATPEDEWVEKEKGEPFPGANGVVVWP